MQIKEVSPEIVGGIIIDQSAHLFVGYLSSRLGSALEAEIVFRWPWEYFTFYVFTLFR